MHWKRSRRRGVSVVRIALFVLLIGAVGAYGLWRARPLPPPWHAVGADRIETPAFDVAGETSRAALRSLSSAGLNTYRGDWLGWACGTDKSMPSEIYLLTDSGERYRPGLEWTPVRITATLGAGGGEIVREEFALTTNEIVRRQRRLLDVDVAERFRTLLLEGAYVDLAPSGPACSDSPTITLESCIRGRYFGALRHCADPEAVASLSRLATSIGDFARDGATPVPILKPPVPAPDVTEAVDLLPDLE